MLCPVTGLTPPTAYNTKGCRCGVCRAYLRDREREYRAAQHKATGKPLTDKHLTTRYSDLWAQADAAFRVDPEYVIAIAESMHEVISEFDVSAYAA